MNVPLSFVGLKFRRNLEDYGWLVTIRKVVGYLLRAFYTHQIYRIYSIDLTEPDIPAQPNGHGLSFKVLNATDDCAINQIENDYEWLRGNLKKSINLGALCLTAFEGDRVAGFNLIGFGKVSLHLVNMQRNFRPGHAWSEQIAVHKAFRQKGLGAQLRYRIFEELKSRGIERLYGGALTSNIASLKLARKVGFREIADVHYKKILGRDSWRLKRVKQ